jgi:uncharacterized OB-fold protein
MMIPSSQKTGVVAAGTYLPAYAVPTRRGAIPICNGDEDAVTLAIEAGLALLHPDSDGDNAAAPGVEELILVAGGGPTLGGAQAEVVREALGLPEGTRVSLSSGGDRLGVVSALLSAMDAVAVGRISSAMVIVSEVGDGQQIGAGAAAVLVAPSAEPAIRITGIRSDGAVVFDRWQEPSAHSSSNEPRYIQHTVERALAALLDTADPSHGSVVLTGASPGAARSASVGTALRHIPDFGCAGPLFAMIIGAREFPTAYTVAAVAGSRTALVGCAAGAGSAEVLADPLVDGIVAGGKPEPAVAPMLSLPSSSPFFERSARELLRLEGARCRQCGHVAFPPTQRPICAECQSTSFDRQPLSRRGSVYTFTVNHFLPVGFGTQMILVLAELDDGYRYWAPASGVRADDVAIGDPVRLGVRRFTNDGGVPVYAMKFLAERSASAALTAAS